VYAAGEIILVVIGILIALQINNWNNERIQRQNALEMSERLLVEAQANYTYLNNAIKRHEIMLKSDLDILQMMGPDFNNQDGEKLDSLMVHTLIASRLDIQDAVLQQAINNDDFNQVVSTDLKNSIYQIPTIFLIIQGGEQSFKQFTNGSMLTVINKVYSLRDMDYRFSPHMTAIGPSKFSIDSRIILGSFEFENILQNKYYESNSVFENYKTLRKHYRALMIYLKTEIDKYQ
jgi:hypothetical protein